jgi:hypothetical protein
MAARLPEVRRAARPPMHRASWEDKARIDEGKPSRIESFLEVASEYVLNGRNRAEESVLFTIASGGEVE